MICYVCGRVWQWEGTTYPLEQLIIVLTFDCIWVFPSFLYFLYIPIVTASYPKFHCLLNRRLWKWFVLVVLPTINLYWVFLMHTFRSINTTHSAIEKRESETNPRKGWAPEQGMDGALLSRGTSTESYDFFSFVRDGTGLYHFVSRVDLFG